MIHTIPFLVLILTLATVHGDNKRSNQVVELPSPNSGTYSFKEAEARKTDLLSNKATSLLTSWKNPYSGFSIHIHKDDSITIYNPSGLLKLFVKQKKLSKQSVDEVKALADSIPLYGNPAGILITSDVPLKESKIVHKILTDIFEPAIQIFYVKKSKKKPSACRKKENPKPAATQPPNASP